jgi:putative ABC transport system permease protein
MLLERARRIVTQGGRMLWRRPIASAASVLCLGFAVAACAVAWSLVSAVILQPFGLSSARQLVVAWETDPALGQPLIEVSLLNYLDWRQRARTLDEMAAFGSSHWPASVRIGEEMVPLAARGVSATFFATLGVTPALGRDFRPADAEPETLPPIILSDRLWRSRLGADPAVIGRRLFVDGSDAVVVGVMPPGFAYPDDPDAWISVERVLGEALRTMPIDAQRQVGVLEVLGRRRPGVSIGDVRRELTGIIADIRRLHRTPQQSAAEVRAFGDALIGALGSRLWIALGLGLGVLLFACANVAAVRLASARERAQELGTRRALGASQGRLVAELAGEAALLVLAALPVAAGSWQLLIGLIARSTAVVDSGVPIGVDRASPTLVIAALAVASWILAGLIPAILSARRAQAVSLDASVRVVRGTKRVGVPLLVSESAMTVVAVAVAVTAMQTFERLSRIDVGFATSGVTLLDISVPSWKYPTPADGRRLLDNLRTALGGLPGVVHAAGVSVRPFRFGEVADGLPVRRAGESTVSPDQATGASRVVVTPEYFDAIGHRLVEGRLFTAFDTEQTPPVVIVSRTLARALWGQEPATGKQLETFTLSETWRPRLVVGVVADAQYRGLERPSLELYMPHTQSTAPLGSLIVAGSPGARLSEPILRPALQRVEPDIALERVQTTGELLHAVLGPARLLATIMGLLGAAGLVLLTLGTFGAVATALRAAWPEIAVRQAIGARPVQAARAPIRLLIGSLATGTGAGVAVTPLVLSAAAATGLAGGRPSAVSISIAGAIVVIAAVIAVLPSLVRAAWTSPAELLRER